MKDYSKEVSLCDFPNEVWRDIQGYEGIYQVSNLGRVKSLERKVNTISARGKPFQRTTKERILRQRTGKRGYPYVILCLDGFNVVKKAHRLVAETFIPNPQNKPQVDHINTIKTDNRVSNLKWCTCSENCLNPITSEKHRIYASSPEQISRLKKIAKRWIQRDPRLIRKVRNKNTKEIFNSITDAALTYNTRVSLIYQSCRNGCRAGGYYWEYVNAR